MDDDLKTFLIESMELINRVEEYLLAAEAQKETGMKEIISAFGNIHSIKGNAMYLNFSELVSSCQIAENFLSNKDRSPKVPSEHEFECLFRFIDAVREFFKNLELNVPPDSAHIRLSQWLKQYEYQMRALPIDSKQKDTVIEFFNMGTQKAAEAFNQLVGGVVKLETSSVEIYPGDEDFAKTGALPQLVFSVSRQGFYCRFSGEVLTMFPKDDSQRLTSLLTEMDSLQEGFEETHQGTVVEIGNILTNHIIGSVSNILGQMIDYTVPVYQLRTLSDLFKGDFSQSAENIFAVSTITFKTRQNDFESHLIILIKIKALPEFLSTIEEKVVKK